MASTVRMPEVVYRDELARLAAYDEVDVRLTLTREWPTERFRPTGSSSDDTDASHAVL